MVGHSILLGGRAVMYLSADDKVPTEIRNDLVGFDFLEDRELQRHPRVRRVLTTPVRPAPVFYGLLHWSDGTDLNALDRKVASGEATDEDFSGAVLAEPRTIVCRDCEAQLRVIAVDPGQPIFASTIAQRLQEHQLKSTCPVCRAQLTLPIVELLGEDLDP